jgi:hypothetical protein
LNEKIAILRKKSQKYFVDSKIIYTFADVLQHVLKARPNGCKGFASLAQLARARDL